LCVKIGTKSDTNTTCMFVVGLVTTRKHRSMKERKGSGEEKKKGGVGVFGEFVIPWKEDTTTNDIKPAESTSPLLSRWEKTRIQWG